MHHEIAYAQGALYDGFDVVTTAAIERLHMRREYKVNLDVDAFARWLSFFGANEQRAVAADVLRQGATLVHIEPSPRAQSKLRRH